MKDSECTSLTARQQTAIIHLFDLSPVDGTDTRLCDLEANFNVDRKIKW